MSNIELIFKAFKLDNPNPKTELVYNNDFELLICVILSAQATDVSVNKATSSLFKIANTPKTVLDLGEEGLIKYIRNIGLFNSKAKNIIKACSILIERYSSKVPNKMEELITLPGVGRKTANVVLNSLFNKNTIAVDTHVFRVSKRLGLSNSKSVEAVEKDLLNIIPKKYLKNAHHWLVLHGRYVCKARKPLCENCIVANYCDFKL